MVAATLPRVMPEVFAHEGGWSDHPSDPGGATMKGITIGVFTAWLGRNASKTELRNISDETATAIYRERYWKPLRGDELPAGVDYATLDGGINSGVSRGAKWLQRAVGAQQDGQVGPKTVKAANGARDTVQVVKDICKYRLGFVQALKTFSVFGRGWSRRIAEVEALGVTLALEARGVDPRARLEAERSRAEATASLNGQGATAAGGTSAAAGGATTIDPSIVDQSSSLPGVVLLVIGVIVAGVLIYRWNVNRQRAAAYAARKDATP